MALLHNPTLKPSAHPSCCGFCFVLLCPASSCFVLSCFVSLAGSAIPRQSQAIELVNDQGFQFLFGQLVRFCARFQPFAEYGLQSKESIFNQAAAMVVDISFPAIQTILNNMPNNLVAFLPAWCVIPTKVPPGIEVQCSIFRRRGDEFYATLSSDVEIITLRVVSSVADDGLRKRQGCSETEPDLASAEAGYCHEYERKY